MIHFRSMPSLLAGQLWVCWETVVNTTDPDSAFQKPWWKKLTMKFIQADLPPATWRPRKVIQRK